MPIMHTRCAHPGCGAPGGPVRCQDCGKRFCADHVAATDFAGIRHLGARSTHWTRFLCAGCAARANRGLLTAALPTRGHAAQDEQGFWWSAPQPHGKAAR